MLSKKIHLNIDTCSFPNTIKVTCRPTKFGIENDGPTNEIGISICLTDQQLMYAKGYDFIPDAIYRQVLDELLGVLYVTDLTNVLTKYVSPEDPIYHEFLRQREDLEYRKRLYSLYFDEESLYELKRQISQIVNANID